MTKKVAIVGAAYRFPGAPSIDAFNQALRNGSDLVTEVEEGRWDKTLFQHPDRKHPGTSVSFAAGSLGDVSGFDADFFGISPREAAQMDPQQRIMLELAWETLEHAGIKPSSLRGSHCGVFLGVASLDYSYRLMEDLEIIDTTSATSNTGSIVSNRLSYLFDLHGPSMSIDTACSSAMVAFHQACAAIRAGETSMALTGGVSLHLHPFAFLTFSKASMLSANGRCRSFDADGDGYARSEGAGLFLLKDFDQAVADGDRILAVVAGSGTNTDGNKQGLTVPNATAQTALMDQTLAQAGLSADDLTYLEAHGTGTSVGDPIEVEAIGEALGQKRQQPLPIGSIKSNLGHMETASAVAGIAKALHVLTQREIPATIGIRTLNPKLKSEQRNIEVVTQPQRLPSTGKLVVGVNSFGFGGANAHIVLESAPETALGQAANDTSGVTTGAQPTGPFPLYLSARHPQALREQAAQLAGYINEPSCSAPLDRIASELWFRRDHLRHGVLLWPHTGADALAQLNQFAQGAGPQPEPVGERLKGAAARAKGAVFVYSGNGCQWLGMGKALLAAEPIYAEAIDEVDALYRELSDFSLRDELEGLNGDRLDATEVAQPTLFALQVGLTRVLASRGVTPAAVVGHSVGEVTAAWAAGALSLAQAVQVIHWRSFHQGRTRGSGAMMAAVLSPEQTEEWLADPRFNEVVVAGHNSATGVTLAGPAEQIKQLSKALTRQHVFARMLPLDYAFHSPAMAGIQQGLEKDLADIAPAPVSCPMYSTVTGAPIDGKRLDADYWWLNIRQPVEFHAGIKALIDDGYRLFVELGAHPILKRYLSDTLAEQNVEGKVLESLKRPRANASANNPQELAHTIAQLWLSGIPVGHDHWLSAAAPRVDLPHYAWQRSRHWYTNTGDTTGVIDRHIEHPLLGYRLKGHDLSWQHQLDTQRQPWLADHNVGDTVIFPGAGFTELALAAAASWQARTLLEIEALEIRSPLILESAPSKTIQLDVTPSDGSWRIRARETASHDEWHLHAQGRIPPQTLGLSLKHPAPALPERSADMDGQHHYALANQLGLAYGPAFQGVEQIWLESDGVLARLRPDHTIADTQHHCLLPPGLLDSAFQLFIPLLERLGAANAGMAFVPVRLERVQFDLEAGTPTLARLQLTQRSPHSLCADIELFNADGNAVAVVEGARFKAARLRQVLKTAPAHLVQTLVPAPQSRSVSRETVAAAIEPASLTRLREAALAANSAYNDELEPLLDVMLEAFVQEGAAAASASERQPLEQLAQRIGLDLANAEPVDASATEIWQLALRDYPDYANLVLPLGRVSYHLRQPEKTPLDAANLWRAALSEGCWHQASQVLDEALQQRLAELAPGSRITLVEVANHTLEWLPRLNQACQAHTINKQVIALDESARHNAHILRESVPDLGLYGLEELPDNRNGEPALVLIDAGISSTQLKQLLEALPSHFSPGTQLLALSPAHARWQTLAAEFAANAEQRPLNLDELAATLELFDYTCHRQDEDAATRLLSATQPGGQQVLITENTHEAAVGDWLICSDSHTATLGEQLTQALNRAGQHVVHLNPPLLPKQWDGAAGHVIDLSGVGSLTPTQRLSRAAAWWQRIEAGANDTQLWLFTQEATHQWQANPGAEHSVDDAAVWGFGRSLQNEAGTGRVRLVDLPAASVASPGDELVQALVNQLTRPDHELEVAFAADGHRFATRLLPVDNMPAEHQQSTLTLGFDTPGQLRNLRWKPRTLPDLSDTDVEIDVQATGLNFRDVMYSLGLLSDEAVEQGFAGASLGLEFAGRVVRTGPGVTRFKTGDAVVGFGPFSFSTRLIAAQQCLARVPEGISHAAAATLPTTFFTVYYALKHQARLEPGERLLIHGAAGGVGLAALQIGRWLGAEIYATAGSNEKRDTLRLLGVDHIYDSRSTTFGEALLADTHDGEGVDVVLNSLAGEAIHQNLRILRPFGRFIELGKRDFYDNTPMGLRPFRNNLSYFGVDSDQLMRERPALTERLFNEMMALFADGTLAPLPYTAFSADRVVDAYRFMQQARQIGKVVVTYERPPTRATLPASEATPSLAADASYLVTGGLGGFGLATAEWLASCGARHLVLLSRSGRPTAEAQEKITALEQQGVKVQLEACDVTQREPLAALTARLRASDAPLKGIIHAATVIDDALVRDLTETRIATNLDAKITGAHLLDELTRADSLDFFVLFSSATTLFGNPGQSAYVAANQWLEAFAAQRRAQGLTTTCISWAAIEDVGFLARNTRARDHLTQRLGGRALTAAEALKELGNALTTGITNEGILPLDWDATARFLPTADAPRFSLLPSSEQAEDTSADDQDLKAQLATLSQPELYQALVKLLRRELATILLSEEASLDEHRSVYDMGFDSLMGVELVTALEGKLGIQVPVMILNDSATIAKLADYLAERLREDSGAAASEHEAELAAEEIKRRHGLDDD